MPERIGEFKACLVGVEISENKKHKAILVEPEGILFSDAGSIPADSTSSCKSRFFVVINKPTGRFRPVFLCQNAGD